MKSRLWNDRSFRWAILLTLGFFSTGIICLLLGYAEFNLALFILLPIVLGISIGALPNRRWALIGAGMATIVFMVGLLTLGLSGLICVVMALPLIIPFIFLGSVILHLVQRYYAIRSDSLPLLAIPLLVFLVVAPIDRFLGPMKVEVIEVTSERFYDHPPVAVYDAIKSVDTIVVDKPYLMRFDLPVPTHCVLEKEEVGGVRTCYFNGGNFSRGDFGGGRIVERITELERGRIIRMDITDYDLIGRKWLGFNEATYYFNGTANGGCVLTRTTSYTSNLQPRWYWKPLEQLGIEQEHDYVLRNLEKDLQAMAEPDRYKRRSF